MSSTAVQQSKRGSVVLGGKVGTRSQQMKTKAVQYGEAIAKQRIPGSDDEEDDDGANDDDGDDESAPVEEPRQRPSFEVRRHALVGNGEPAHTSQVLPWPVEQFCFDGLCPTTRVREVVSDDLAEALARIVVAAAAVAAPPNEEKEEEEEEEEQKDAGLRGFGAATTIQVSVTEFKDLTMLQSDLHGEVRQTIVDYIQPHINRFD